MDNVLEESFGSYCLTLDNIKTLEKLLEML